MAELKPWERPTEDGELPGELCCQRSVGGRCYDHNPANYEEASASAPPACTIYSEPCPVHDFVHGAEAEELRSGIEAALLTTLTFGDGAAVLQQLLDKVDARDSLAYREAQEPDRVEVRKGPSEKWLRDAVKLEDEAGVDFTICPPPEPAKIAGGSYSSEVSPSEFERRCGIAIACQQAATNPDNTLITLLCDGVRLVREGAEHPSTREAIRSELIIEASKELEGQRRLLRRVRAAYRLLVRSENLQPAEILGADVLLADLDAAIGPTDGNT